MSNRRGGGRGGRNPRDMPRDVQVSRKVSWLLRHGAEQEGLKLGKGGYVGVAEAVSALPFLPLPPVEMDRKKSIFTCTICSPIRVHGARTGRQNERVDM